MENKKNSQLKKVTFFADVMLGRLAKWLRILGYDTAYDPNISSQELVSKARSEGRIVLTRNKKLTKTLSSSEYIFIEYNRFDDQLKQVVKELDLDISSELFTRCIECNEAIVFTRREEIEGEVPDFIYKRYEEFSKCLKCGRVFWPGTHINRAEEVIKSLKE